MAKPTIDVNKLEWASSDLNDSTTNNQDNRVEPSSAKKTYGWLFLEKPPFNWFNYWMNLVYQFMKWIVEEVIEGTFTFTGAKTFSDTTQSVDKDTGAVIIGGGLGVEKNISSGGIIRYVTGIEIKYRDDTPSETVIGNLKKRIEIGDWNMDSNASVNVLHNMDDHTKIRSIQVMIIDDTGTNMRPLNNFNSVSKTNDGGVTSINSTQISLGRLDAIDGGVFDSVNYDSTSYNRGWITVEYEL